MKILINYADINYSRTQKFNSLTGKYIGKFDKVISFGPNDIDSYFKEKNKHILETKRGNGLWLWKPYFIYKTLLSCNEGDIVFYCDSGSFFVRKIDYLIDSMEQSEKIWVSDIPLLEVNFTKPDCFVKMGCDKKFFKYTNQIQGTFFMAVCCDESKKFVEKWLELCEDYELLSPTSSPDGLKSNQCDFLSHREDQSILSLLCKKEGIHPHLDPSNRGRYQELYYTPNYPFIRTSHKDTYKPIVFLHKFAYVNLIGFLRIAIRMVYKKFKYKKIVSTLK
ncbi:hypothetical protein AB3U99_21935 [Niallia sp. JL1B1071]|uniref:hypothetical protein n=1 Tax=Niallia tiangongensis TaxID=3237105 RepID=UPI0037DC75BC